MSFSLLLALFTFTACQVEKSVFERELEKAYVLAEEKNWSECIEKIQELLDKHEDITAKQKSEAWLLLINALISDGQVMEASELLELLIEDNEFGAEVKIKLYEKIIQIHLANQNHEELAKARINLLVLEQKIGKMNSVQSIKNLIQIGLDYQHGQNFLEANKVFDLVLEKTKDVKTMAEIQYYKANGDFYQGNLDSAQSILEKTLENKEVNGQILGQISYLLGEIYEVQENYPLAYSQFKIALVYYPNRKLVERRLNYILTKHASKIGDKKVLEQEIADILEDLI